MIAPQPVQRKWACGLAAGSYTAEASPGTSIFITAPIPELERRLRERASESEGEIGERIGLARKQLNQAEQFDYVVLNDDVGRATGELEDIVQRELAAAGTMSRP